VTTNTHYDERRRTGFASDVETWLGNTLATLLAAGGIACGVIGMLVAFDYIDTSVNTPFDNGIIWLVSGLVLALSANVFRREHHIVDRKSDFDH
jgi:hypothetical protein